ncbi:MAG: fasciclin domain-containing protein [Planctomycetes bacterium]|nr:fasciclin domain-containing protein [Planctomycetota bacterium]
MPPSEPNLVEVATKAGSFGTLLTAAKAAGLADTLATGGPFTVFAPTDAAFAKLGKDTIADLLKPENKGKLVSILKHHVVAGKVMAADAMKLKQAKTIGDTALSLQSDGTSLTVGGAKVVTPDVAAKNGVIHVVDAVILPAN